jgi:hypothetical protein
MRRYASGIALVTVTTSLGSRGRRLAVPFTLGAQRREIIPERLLVETGLRRASYDCRPEAGRIGVITSSISRSAPALSKPNSNLVSAMMPVGCVRRLAR